MTRSERQAHQVRQRYGGSLARILRGENIQVVEQACWWKELFVADDRRREICLRRGLPRAEKRALLAHALGHHFLHRGNRFYFAETDPEALETQEREAWEFAAYLLIPTAALARPAHRPLPTLARRFRVPVDFMRLRWVLEAENPADPDPDPPRRNLVPDFPNRRPHRPFRPGTFGRSTDPATPGWPARRSPVPDATAGCPEPTAARLPQTVAPTPPGSRRL